MVAEKYADRVRENKPIEYAGLTFHPLTVRDYGLWQTGRPVYELLLSSLPPAMARLSWCSCLAEMDKSGKTEGKNPQFLNNALRVMAKALRLMPVIDPISKTAEYPIHCEYLKEPPTLNAIRIGRGTDTVILNIQQMNEVREIIAAQNGYEIPNENWNPELVAAAKYHQHASTSDLEWDIDSMVQSVAHHAHVRSKDIWDWPIREFQMEQKAIDRALKYQIYTQAELSGMVKFKHGNPCPSWMFDRKAELPTGFVSIADLDAGAKGLLGSPTIKEN